MRVSGQVCTARDRKIQMPQICLTNIRGCYPEASRILRRCIGDASGKIIYWGEFGDASPNIRRCIADHSSRQKVGSTLPKFQCRHWIYSQHSRCLPMSMTSSMHRRCIGKQSRCFVSPDHQKVTSEVHREYIANVSKSSGTGVLNFQYQQKFCSRIAISSPGC